MSLISKDITNSITSNIAQSISGSNEVSLIDTIFPSGTKGFMLELEEGRAYQDAGITVAESDTDPIGRIISPQGLILDQTTGNYRPLLGVSGSLVTMNFDDTNDTISTTFSSGTLPSDCSLIYCINTLDVAFIAFDDGPNDNFLGCSTISSSDSFRDAGTPTVWVNNTQISNNRTALKNASVIGSWVLIDYRNVDPSLWTKFGILGYGGGWHMDGILNNKIMMVESQYITEDNRMDIYNLAATGTGLNFPLSGTDFTTEFTTEFF